MRDGSWTGYLGAAKLSGACQPDGKISAEFHETASAVHTPSDDTLRPFTPPASYGRLRNCQTYDIPFSKTAMLPGDRTPFCFHLVVNHIMRSRKFEVDLTV